MKILSVTVVPNSAIDGLAESVQQYNEDIEIDVLPIHPKRPSKDDLRIFAEKAQEADLIDFQYWKSAEMLLKLFPKFRNKVKTLTHHNPYDWDKSKWQEYDLVVANNIDVFKKLSTIVEQERLALIHNAIDLNKLKFNQEYTKNKQVLMVTFRTEGHKGVVEVAKACKELGYKFVLVGHISKPSYFEEIKAIGVDFREDITDEELLKVYNESAILVCNSSDNFETGPLPVMEAMALGVPVLSRNIGIVPELNNDENMVVRGGTQDDIEDLKNELQALMENEDRRLKIREKAWNTIRNFSSEKRAREYFQIWNKAMFPDEPLVSVIIPTFNRKQQVLEILESLYNQTYRNIEVVICDDGSTDGTEMAVKELREKYQFPIKYIDTWEESGYGLAEARNRGVIEANGEVIVFCDSRLKPYSGAIFEFVKNVTQDREKIWYFGEKGGGKRNFVENFSAIRRKYFIQAGMFCERIDRYGGMTQELSMRFKKQDFTFKYVQSAKAKEILSSKAKNKKDDIYKSKLKIYKMYGERPGPKT